MTKKENDFRKGILSLPFFRRGLRKIFIEREANWTPVTVRKMGDDEWQIERYGGLRGLPYQGIRFSLSNVPVECRTHFAVMLNLLIEQAEMADLARDVAMESIERDSRAPKASPKGAEKTAKKAARRFRRLDGLIRACLERGEPTRYHAKEWEQKFKTSRETVRRHVNQVKAKFAKGR